MPEIHVNTQKYILFLTQQHTLYQSRCQVDPAKEGKSLGIHGSQSEVWGLRGSATHSQENREIFFLL